MPLLLQSAKLPRSQVAACSWTSDAVDEGGAGAVPVPYAEDEKELYVGS